MISIAFLLVGLEFLAVIFSPEQNHNPTSSEGRKDLWYVDGVGPKGFCISVCQVSICPGLHSVSACNDVCMPILAMHFYLYTLNYFDQNLPKVEPKMLQNNCLVNFIQMLSKTNRHFSILLKFLIKFKSEPSTSTIKVPTEELYLSKQPQRLNEESSPPVHAGV